LPRLDPEKDRLTAAPVVNILAGAMKILVCVKSVPDPQSSFELSEDGRGYWEDGLNFKVNEYDLYAMEEAVRIKERFGAHVTAVSAGRPRVEEQLRKAMGLGADRGVLIDQGDAPAMDALSVASCIAAWARDEAFDLVLAGVMSEDMARCQTGPMLARLLDMPCATTVIKAELSDDLAEITCERELEGGLREKVLLVLPAVLTVQSGINLPRYPSLSNVLRVKGLEIERLDAKELGPVRACETLVRTYAPERKSSCEFVKGPPREAARELVEKIRSRAPVV